MAAIYSRAQLDFKNCLEELPHMFFNVKLNFKVPPKTPKMGVFGYLGGTENGTWGARIKILRTLFNTKTTLKPPFRHFGNHFGPRKSDFWPFYFF